jgi:hypothetical protein
MTNMLTDKGAAYTVEWPFQIASRVGLSVEYVADALNATTGSTVARTAFYQSQETNTPVAEIAALTGPTAKQVVTALRAILAGIKARAETNCHYCGLDLDSNGECPQCGDQTVGEFFR